MHFNKGGYWMKGTLILGLIFVSVIALAIYARISSSALVITSATGQEESIKKIEDVPGEMTVRGPAEIVSERYAMQVFFPSNRDDLSQGQWNMDSIQVFRAGYTAPLTGEINKSGKYLVVLVEDSDAPYLNSEIRSVVITLKK
jgi:hypothetical protein